MSAVLTGEGKQVDTKPPKRQPAFAHEDRVALNEDSPFLLLAAAVVQQARVDQAHRCMLVWNGWPSSIRQEARR